MPDEQFSEKSSRGPARAPRSFARRFVTGIVIAGLVAAGAGALIAAGGVLPSDTQAGSLAVRAAAALAIGVVLIFLVRRMLGALGDPPPPPPPTVEAAGSGVVYECPVCGTRLRLEIAATTKAPKHCGEEMEARIG